ncbi:hypothetical protein M422DRAFT_256568 [Sphaerobolus stellatus SS14]|uniref:Uncharacterized protein n=1 Tax=Sphaerobolus stellatus (strain SS14) TaxID=990650 RepID=A0A0C9VGN8_SPHS4|nr:hypothetical protein M422DRAFT_256568 [Sphaerobolus stellatus SS14]
MSEPNNDPLESVKAVAKQTIQVGTNTPFNAIRIYQKYAMALAMSSMQPPTTQCMVTRINASS